MSKIYCQGKNASSRRCLSYGQNDKTHFRKKRFEGQGSLLWSRQWQPTPVLLPGKSHGRRSLVGCSPLGLEESDTTERLHFHFSLSCIGERNGNPLQCSCLENLSDGGAWWAAVYGVAQNRTQLKQFSSSSRSLLTILSWGRGIFNYGGLSVSILYFS